MGWLSGNVQMHIWPLEHCLAPIDRWHYGPHVSAVCQPENWSARIAFSMHYDHVYLYDVVPLGVHPKKTVLQRLLDEVQENRFKCRALWWKNMQCVCLSNASVVKLASGNIDIVDQEQAQQGTPGRIVSGSGFYMAKQGVKIDVEWFRLACITKEFLPEV